MSGRSHNDSSKTGTRGRSRVFPEYFPILLLLLIAAAGIAILHDRCASGVKGPAVGRLGALPGGLKPSDLSLIVVTLDTTRADRIGCYGATEVETPNLDALARRGVLFENAISPTPLTLPAHSSLFTGLEPGAHGVRDNGGFRLPAGRATLASVLRARGWRTGGFVSAYVLDHRWGIAQGFDHYFDDFDLSKFKSVSMGDIQRRGDETLGRAMEWIERPGTGKFFAWIHFYDPHAPYDPPEPFASRYEGRPYNGEIAWTDSLVGRLLDGLERLGLTGRTIVAVIGDHGESLGEHGENGHGFFIYEQTTRVPFILAAPYPGLAGRRVREVVRHVDFAPTLLDLLGQHDALGSSGTTTAHEPGIENRVASSEQESAIAALARDAGTRIARHLFPASGRGTGSDARFSLVPEAPTGVARGSPSLDNRCSQVGSLRFSAVGDALVPPAIASDAVSSGPSPTPSPSARPIQGKSLVPLLAGAAAGEGPEGYSEAFFARFHYGWSELRSIRTERWHFIEAPREELYDVRADPEERTNLAAGEPSVVDGMRAALARTESEIGAPQAAPAPIEEDEETQRKLAALGYVGSVSNDEKRSWKDLPDPKDRIRIYNLMNRAREETLSEDPDRAIATLREVLAGDPEVIDAWFMLGNCFFKKRDFEQAAANYRRTLEKKPDHDYAMIGLADTLVGENRVDEAVLGYRRFLERDRDNAQITYRLAQVLLDAGRNEEAEREFARTLEIEPRTAQARIGLAIVAFRRRDFAASRAAIEAALAIDPKAPNARYNLALILEAEGDPAAAASAYRAEIADHPSAYKTHFNLGRLLGKMGDTGGAVASLRRCAEENPRFAVGRFYLAQALLAAGDLAAAESEAREGLRLDDGSEYAALGHYVLSDVLSRRGRRAESDAEYRKGRAIEASPRTPAGRASAVEPAPIPR